MLHLETLFRKWLSAVSNPIDMNAMPNSGKVITTFLLMIIKWDIR